MTHERSASSDTLVDSRQPTKIESCTSTAPDTKANTVACLFTCALACRMHPCEGGVTYEGITAQCEASVAYRVHASAEAPLGLREGSAVVPGIGGRGALP
jgi:hypothetical protein